MYISAPTLDDLLRAVYTRLLKVKTRIVPTRGEMVEVTGVLLRIQNPRARLSRSEIKGRIFSCIGELLWYLAGSNSLKFISYYIKRYINDSDDGRTIFGAYGPRLIHPDGPNQIQNIISLLTKKRASRRAAIQLFRGDDLVGEHSDIPCTCTLQFLVRHERLEMITYMRSNDAYLGLPHDVLSFTMLQELIARSLGLEMGSYKHAVGSLHLYEEHRRGAQTYLNEGWHSTTAMPPMPVGDQWPAVRKVLSMEKEFRLGRSPDIEGMRLDSYWKDVLRLLAIFQAFRKKDGKTIRKIKSRMTTRVYEMYINDKNKTVEKLTEHKIVTQLPLALDESGK